jgi:hypothetical protein
MTYVEVEFIDTANTAYNVVRGDLKVAAAVAKPASTADVTTADATDPFTDWGHADVTDSTMAKAQFATYFQDSTNTVYFEAGDTEDVWITEGSTTAGTNINTPDFVLVGAVNLTVAATSAIIASLLF